MLSKPIILIQACSFQLLLSQPVSFQPNRQPEDAFLKLSVQEAIFKWEVQPKTDQYQTNLLANIERLVFSLNVEKFTINSNTIVGITGEDGSGKTSFVLALLGHMPLQTGDYRRLGAISYYSELPYMMPDSSIRQNVAFAGNNLAKVNESRYRETLETVQLHNHMNSNFDTAPLEKNALDVQWLQRISLARALYEDR